MTRGAPGAGLILAAAAALTVLAGCGSSATTTASQHSTPSGATSPVGSISSSPQAGTTAGGGGLPEPKQANPCAALTPAIVRTLSASLASVSADTDGPITNCAYATSDEDSIQLSYEAGPLSGRSTSLAECVAISNNTAQSAVGLGGGNAVSHFPALGASGQLLVEPYTHGLGEDSMSWTQGDGCFFFSAELGTPISTAVFDQAALSIAGRLGT